MCGFVGVAGERQSFSEIYEALIAIQHRGQDAAGITTFDGRFHTVKDAGLVTDVFAPEHVRLLTGQVGIGHVRYPTTGAGGGENAQPFLAANPYGIAMAHNGQVTNFVTAREKLLTEHQRYVGSECDLEILLHYFALELDRCSYGALTFDDICEAVARLYTEVKGSYSVVGLLANGSLFGFRDPNGIRPMLVGQRRTDSGALATMCASESVVLQLQGYTENLRDVEPGEVVYVGPDRELQSRRLASRQHFPCIFEYIYFARPDSFLDRVSVYKTRERLGEKLADAWKEAGYAVDVIMPVPDSSRPAAFAMAQKLGIRYREGLVKNRYVGRTFIMPGVVDRRKAIRRKLNTIDIEFAGRDVLLVDDSIVRGNTVKEIIRLARAAGARRVYFASCSAPLTHPCVYGVDMATRRDFIAYARTVEEINSVVGADALLYLSLPDMLDAARWEGAPSSFCHACFTGEYPTEDIGPEILESFERDRRKATQRLPSQVH